MNNFGDLHYILAISLQFSAIFLCFSTVFLHFGHFLGVSRQLFAYFSQFKDQLNWTNDHIQISLIFPQYIKFFWTNNHVPKQSYATKNMWCKLGILPVFDNIRVQELINELRWRGWIRSERPSKKHIARVCKYHSRITIS